MKEKWADYLIYEIHYDATRTRVSRMRIGIDEGVAVDEGGEYLRQDVIAAMKSGASFVTAFQDPSTRFWTPGKPVVISTLGAGEFLKTENDDSSPADNVGSLPEF